MTNSISTHVDIVRIATLLNPLAVDLYYLVRQESKNRYLDYWTVQCNSGNLPISRSLMPNYFGEFNLSFWKSDHVPRYIATFPSFAGVGTCREEYSTMSAIES